MDGIQRIYHTGFQYAKKQYVPNNVLSMISIIIYTSIVFILTEYIMRGKITRWLYMGSIIMIISMIYSGSLTLSL